MVSESDMGTKKKNHKKNELEFVNICFHNELMMVKKDNLT